MARPVRPRRALPSGDVWTAVARRKLEAVRLWVAGRSPDAIAAAVGATPAAVSAWVREVLAGEPLVSQEGWRVAPGGRSRRVSEDRLWRVEVRAAELSDPAAKPDTRELADLMAIRGRLWGVAAWEIAARSGVPVTRVRMLVREFAARGEPAEGAVERSPARRGDQDRGARAGFVLVFGLVALIPLAARLGTWAALITALAAAAVAAWEHLTHTMRGRAGRRWMPPEATLATLRERVVARTSGLVAEIGSGAGEEWPYYPPAVREIAGVEPDPLRRAEAAVRHEPRARLAAGVHELEPAAYDAAVLSLVLCCASDRARLRQEARRVVKPGGRVWFFEHERSRAAGRAAGARRPAVRAAPQ